MDPLDHERMILRHVTRCTSAPERPPSRTGSSLRKGEVQTFTLTQGLDESDSTPSFVSSPTSSHSHSLDSIVPTLTALDGEKADSRIDTAVSNVLIPVERGVPKKMPTDQLPERCIVENINSVKILIDDVHAPKPTIVDDGGASEIPQETEALSSFVSAVEFNQRQPSDNVASRVERKLVAARHASFRASDAAHCPVCRKLFPRMVRIRVVPYTADGLSPPSLT
jgi:hypothetical protein